MLFFPKYREPGSQKYMFCKSIFPKYFELLFLKKFLNNNSVFHKKREPCSQKSS